MARYPKMTAKAYININGENKLWYEVDEDRNVTWYLPEEETKQIVDKAMENVGRHMSRYIQNHPESALWGST